MTITRTGQQQITKKMLTVVVRHLYRILDTDRKIMTMYY